MNKGDMYRVTAEIVNRYGAEPYKYSQLRVGHVLRVTRETKSGNVYMWHDSPFYAVMIHAEDVSLLQRLS